MTVFHKKHWQDEVCESAIFQNKNMAWRKQWLHWEPNFGCICYSDAVRASTWRRIYLLAQWNVWDEARAGASVSYTGCGCAQLLTTTYFNGREYSWTLTGQDYVDNLRPINIGEVCSQRHFQSLSFSNVHLCDNSEQWPKMIKLGLCRTAPAISLNFLDF